MRNETSIKMIYSTMYTLYSTFSMHTKAARIHKIRIFPHWDLYFVSCLMKTRNRIFLQIQYSIVFTFFLSFVLCVSCCTFKLTPEHVAKDTKNIWPKMCNILC
jgi:hypothetical protein